MANRPYTPEENDYLSAHYATATRADILAAVPGRAWSCLQMQAGRLNATGRTMFVPIKERTSWHPANVALLHALYPTGGAAAVAAATGLSAPAVRTQAYRQGLRHLTEQTRPLRGAYGPRNAVKAPKVAGVKVAPLAAREPRPLPLVKLPRAFTPVANAAMSRKRVAASKPSTLAEAIARHKTLKYGQPEHTAFLRGGLNEWNQWKAAQ